MLCRDNIVTRSYETLKRVNKTFPEITVRSNLHAVEFLQRIARECD